MSVVRKVTRTIGPWGAGLAGYDATGRLVVVIPVKTSRPAHWIRQRVTAADRNRVAAAAPDVPTQ